MRAIVAAAAMHERDGRFAEAACGAVRDLSGAGSSGSVGIPACIRDGALKTVASTLRLHSGTASVVDTACIAVHNIAIRAQGKAELSKAGVLRLLLAAMSEHEGNAEVAKAAASALGNWTATMPGDDAVAAHAAAAEEAQAGAVPLLVSLLQRHAGNARVCEAIIRAINGVVNFEEGIAAALDSKPLPASAVDQGAAAAAAGAGKAGSTTCMEQLASLLAAAMSTHAADVGVAVAACSVVTNMGHASAASDGLLLRSRIPALVASALRRHARDANLAMRACAALRNLAMTKRNRAELLRAGAVVALAAAAPYHTGGVGSEDQVIPMLLSALEMVTGYSDDEM